MLYQLHPTNSELEAFAMSASATYSGLIAAIVLLILPLWNSSDLNKQEWPPEKHQKCI